MALRAFWEQFMISLHFQYTFYYLLSFLFFIFAARMNDLHKLHRWMRALHSQSTACWLIGLTAAVCVVGGCMPAEWSFQSSPVFVSLLVALVVHLSLVIIHRMKIKGVISDWAFLATHVGIWLALVSGLAGACLNEELRVMVTKGYENNEAYDRDYRTVRLPYSLLLKDFRIERDAADATPTQYAATVIIDGKEVAEVAINAPHSMGLGEDIYLVDFNPEGSSGNVNACLMMVERQPMKYPMLAGLSLLLLGAIARLKK